MKSQDEISHRAPYPHVAKTEGVCGGDAVIEGTRMAVWHVVNYYYRLGMSVEDILAEWTHLSPAQVFAALAYYHDHTEEVEDSRQSNSLEFQQEPTRAAA